MIFLSAHQLARAIRSRQLSAEEVVQAHLEQITRHNPALNVIVILNEAGARLRAREADAALARGEVWGPLHGVPVTIKDSYETAGLRTTFGWPATANLVPERNASAVERLVAAGAIILGKTNIPKVAFDWQCNSPLFGRTNNPWDLQRTSGGSTAGAAAVAAGLSPLELGSDSFGSIRVPAHFCGIFGFKPTEHRVSGAGHMELGRYPGAPRGLRHIAAFGPLARSVEDLRLCLSVLAGPAGQHWEIPPVPLGTAAEKDLANLRLAWTDDFGGIPVSRDTSAVLEKLAGDLEKVGCRVKRCSPPEFDFNAALETWGQVAGAEMGTQVRWSLRFLYRMTLKARYGGGPWTRGLIMGLGSTVRRYFVALTRRDALITELEQFLGDWDAWLCPVASVPAFTHRRRGTPIEVDGRPVFYTTAAGGHTTVFSLTGNPVVVIPIGYSQEGLPIGIQVVGRRWQDMEVLAVAEQLTKVTGPCPRPPGY